jgi:Restriction endonuclease
MAYQCKRQKRRVPVAVVRELIGSLVHEHRGRKGVLVTSAELTKGARKLASEAKIEVIERTALAQWISRARDRIEQDGNAPPARGLRVKRTPARANATGGWPVVLALVLAACLVVAGTHPVAAHIAARPNASASSPASPAAVVEADFAAISRHNWRAVWQLSRHQTPGFGPAYARMIYGYRGTARDVVKSLKTSGDLVSARVLAYETTGAVQEYRFSYVVRAGKIVWGRSVLVFTHPAPDSGGSRHVQPSP